MLEIHRPVMTSSSDNHYGTTSRSSIDSSMSRSTISSIDSSMSRSTMSSVASSTRAQPSTIISPSDLDIETEESRGSIDTSRPCTPPDQGYNLDQDIEFMSVLCLYDFESDDPDHTPFKKNDILQVIHQEPSGWWAAQVGDHVGWIPSAFVAVIPPEMVDTLQNVSYELRVCEYEAEVLYGLDLPSSPDDQVSFEDGENFQVATSDLLSPRGFPSDVTPAVSGFDLPKGLPSLTSPGLGTFDPWKIQQQQHVPNTFSIPITPRTPRTPIPPKVPAPEPAPPVPRVPRPGLPTLRVNTTPLQLNKPTPPTPVSSTPLSPQPKSSTFPASAILPRSRSLSFVPSATAGRRRPNDLLSDSSASLNRLSTLAESPQVGADNFDDADTLRKQQSLRVARLPPKILRITGDDDAQAFYNAQVAQASQPWYLKPRHSGNEIKTEYDGSVKAGTLEALVERLTMEPLKLEQENTFRHVFLMSFHTFSTADRILELLIERFELESPEGLTHDQFVEWQDKKLRPTQARVLHAFTLWVEMYGLLEDDPQIVPRLREFLELIRSPTALAASAKHIISILDSPRSDANQISVVPSIPGRRNTKKYRNELLKIDPAELARQLTLYEARLYVKVRPHECLTWSGNQKGETVQNLRSFISTSDKIAAWVKWSVLSNDALGKRADTIELWIKVAEKCRALNNYSSMSAIVAALTSQVISRLQLTWAHVNRASHVEPLVKLSEPTNNFATYRQLFSSTDAPCLPYIGIYLSDMVKITETVPDCKKFPASGTTPGLSLINFVKRQKMVDVVHTILRHQPSVRNQYKISEVTPVMQYIEAQLKFAAGKDEGSFWMRSQEVQQAELAHADIRKGLEAAGF